MDDWNTSFLLEWYIFRGYVKLPGCRVRLLVFIKDFKRCDCSRKTFPIGNFVPFDTKA